MCEGRASSNGEPRSGLRTRLERPVSKIGHGYGSEWHLLWYLARHRAELNARICAVAGAESIEWLDFPVTRHGDRLVDGEWKGLDFLANDSVKGAWRTFWPQRAGVPNWDAVGRVRIGGEDTWLLAEAKGHLAEIGSSCAAKPQGGLDTIRKALEATKMALGVDPSLDWLNGYYQSANRLATLHFLHTHAVRARLLFIYFTGDSVHGRECPRGEDGWGDALVAQDQHLGLPKEHPLAAAVHKLFLPAFQNLTIGDQQ